MADNTYNQSMVAYETGPKEKNIERGMPNSNEQFGKANRMPQENKGYKQIDYPANPVSKNETMCRHTEYR